MIYWTNEKMEYLLILPILLSFLITLEVLPVWIKKAKKIGMLWEDMNKFNHPKNVAASGGLIVVLGFVFGLLFYIAIRTFVFKAQNGVNVELFALLSMILLFAIIGLVDDMLGWKKGGLSKRLRVVLCLIASIPLVVINAGETSVVLPIVGTIHFGVLYTLLIIPLAIAGATTTYNFLAGFNGLEAGQGILILSFLSFVAYKTGTSWLAVAGCIMVASLLAFYWFNKCPAKIFPGDILTYSVGGLIVAMAILGNFEKIALIIFIPYFIEIILKARGGLKMQSFAKPNKDNSLELKYNKIYGWTHLSLFILKKFKKKVYERDVTYFIHFVQIIFIIIAALMI